MEIYDNIQMMQEYARVSGKWCMYISWSGEHEPEEVRLAAPYLNLDTISIEFNAILTFDSEEEMDKYYDLTIGDDGLTTENTYIGPARVYALTCNNKGNLQNENT